jgi:hypothetical protein
MTDQVSVGRIVHVRQSDGRHLPGIVTHVWSSSVNVALFTDGSFDGSRDAVERLTSIPEGTDVLTWHWPELVDGGQEEPAPDPPPPSGVNLLTNPGFADGGSGWKFEKGYWTHGSKSNPCESGGDAQCDQDANNVVWPTGAEDSLWQDVIPPAEYSQVTFRSQEIHHHGDNAAAITIYGYDSTSGWVVIWDRVGLDFPKATRQDDWHAREYTFSVAQPYPLLRLEFYGRIDAGLAEGADVGWKFSCLELEVS